MTKPPVHMKLTYPSVPRITAPDKPMTAYQAIPIREEPLPGIVIIHEIFGLDDNIRDIAHNFAKEGYAALAVNLYSGPNRLTCLMQIMYGMLFGSLNNPVVEDLGASVDYLRAHTDVDPARVGVIGFCMGGTYALQLACRDQDLKAASVFYGQNPRPLEAISQSCPIVGSYPERDFTAKHARQLQEALESYAVPHDIKIYPDARHSFFNDRGRGFDPEASADAWQRMLDFFKTHLTANTMLPEE